jgi:hypothetical protein
METFIVFGSFVAIITVILRHRYRMKLLSAAMPRPEFAHFAATQAMTRPGAEAQARIEALEERLEWLERLVRESSDDGARARVASLAAGASKALAAVSAAAQPAERDARVRAL